MRVAVTGATGNVGTSVLRALMDEPGVTSVVGVARRRPDGDDTTSAGLEGVEWVEADITEDDLTVAFRGADAVVHLAWLIQPSHDLHALWRTNVSGSGRVFRAAAGAGVGTIAYASSVGAYSPGPKDRKVDESWPTDGIPTSSYSREKAYVERLLDGFESEHPDVRVVRMRPALIFKAEAASEVRRYFLGPFAPNILLRPSLIPIVPDIPRLRFQAVHSDDVADAFRRALVADVRGPFNLAADPVLDPERLADILGARRVPVPTFAARAVAGLTWRMHLQPAGPGWVDMALETPLLDPGRAARELGWAPQRSSADALLDLLNGLGRGAGGSTPPLRSDAGGPLRSREVTSGVGSTGGT
jgi:nucleoside-diphosphate-sugar epimerase